jgi:hypothetical protein
VSTSMASPEECAIRGNSAHASCSVSYQRSQTLKGRKSQQAAWHLQFRRLLEQELRSDMLLKSPRISVERFSRRQIGHAQGHCYEDGRVGFGRLYLLEFLKLISRVLDGFGCQKMRALNLSKSCSSAVPLVLACRYQLRASSRRSVAAKATLDVGSVMSGATSKRQSNAKNQS